MQVDNAHKNNYIHFSDVTETEYLPCELHIIGDVIIMCFPSRDPQQLGKFHLSANSCSILIQSSLVGSGMTFGCRMSHMAEHVSTIMLCTVDTPTRNLADSVLNESPVAKKLKYINKFSNLYDFVDQFKSNSYWSPTGSPATAIGNLLCTPPVWFENLLFTLYTLAS